MVDSLHAVKDARIIQALRHLDHTAGPGSFEIADHWKADRTAMGVCKAADRSVLAYFALDGPDLFTVILEQHGSQAAVPYEEGGKFEGVTLDELTRIILLHVNAG
jgi:hypothetical protein